MRGFAGTAMMLVDTDAMEDESAGGGRDGLA